MNTLELPRLCDAVNARGVIALADPVPAPPPVDARAASSPTALATFAHELRNSIAPLENALEVIGSGRAGVLTSERMLNLARRQVRHLSRLVNELLDAGQLFDGHPDLQWSDANLQDVVDEAVRAWSRAAIKRGHRITQVMPMRPIAVHVDVLRMQQVLGNLLSNAIKYTLPGGEIRVAVRREGGRATIAISDDGIGMEPSQLDRMFRLFEQDARARALSRDGVGLGLAVARRLAECQGGTLDAFSEGKDMGSTFRLVLPVREVTQ